VPQEPDERPPHLIGLNEVGQCVVQCLLLQEQQPGRLLGAVQLAGAACVIVQDVVDVPEGLLELGAVACLAIA
jgi:hypothetical protein